MTTAPDESYLSSFAAQQQTGSGPGRWDRCPSCQCGWHGMACRGLVPSVGTTSVPCPCPSSFGGGR